jgi:hypothetical protein
MEEYSVDFEDAWMFGTVSGGPFAKLRAGIVLIILINRDAFI